AVLAVSGGADSLSLLEAMVRLRDSLRVTLHVAHCDHGIRPSSPDDADFVRARAAEHGVGFHLGHADPKPPKGRSLEEHLRDQRGAFLIEIANEVGAARILTGHTLDDQAETVLMNLLTGAGRRGLGGMPPTRWRTGRPLIDMRRSDTEDFCKALGLEPRLDETNLDPNFLRNRIRHQIIPLLREINPRLDVHLAHLSDVSRDEDYLLDAAAVVAIPPQAREAAGAVSLEALHLAPMALQRRVVRLLARNEHLALTGAQVDQILAMSRTGREGASVDLDGALSAWLEDGLLMLGRAPSGEPDPGDDA
ncbi:MAG: tRNA lysidine(34) synthetase TilS, partial [Actinomycetota bacterium]